MKHGFDMRIVNTAHANVKRRRQRRESVQFQRQVSSTVAGLACNCVRNAVSKGLNGYRLTRLNGYKLTVLEPRTLAGLGQETGTLALEPVSDKKAVENAVKYFQRASSGTLRGFGDAAQTQTAATYAATGAKVGSIIPVIGTVIGAVVGAVVGWLSAKPKPVRPTAQQIADCKNLLSEYGSFAAQMPDAPLPMDKAQLLEIHWCLQAIYGGKYIGVKDPRWFNPGAEAALFPAALQLVKKIYETPVGATVSIDAITFNDPKGRKLSFQGFNFVNPQFTDLKTFTEQYWMPMAIQYCQNTAGKGAPGCPDYYHLPEFKRWLYDVIAWAARTTLPNISEADLKAASQVAADTGSAAKDVVTAVESILNRNVVKGETSLLLTGQTDTPVQVPGSTGPPVTTLPDTTQSTLPNVPGLTSQTASDITALIKTLIAQGASNNQAVASALDALADRGVDPATVKPAVEQEVAAQTGTASSKTPLILGALAAGLFLFAVPTRKVRR